MLDESGRTRHDPTEEGWLFNRHVGDMTSSGRESSVTSSSPMSDSADLDQAETSHAEVRSSDGDQSERSESFSARPPTTNGHWRDHRTSGEVPSLSTLEAASTHPLAEPALVLYIRQDGVRVGDAVDQLRALGLALPSGFSMSTYFAALSDEDDEQPGDAHDRAALAPSASTVLSPEEWLSVVHDVWVATHASEAEASPQPLGTVEGHTCEPDQEDSPTLVDATAKKRKASVSADLPLPDQAEDVNDTDVAAVGGGAINRNARHTSQSDLGVEASGIAQTAASSRFNSDSASLLRQLFPNNNPNQPRTVTTMSVTAQRPTEAVTTESAARELFKLSGAIPLRLTADLEAAPSPHLTLGGWEHTLRLNGHGKLPPQPIIDDATHTIAALAATSAGSPTSLTSPSGPLGSSLGTSSSLSALVTAMGGQRAVSFGAFYALLMDQLRQVMGDVARGYFTNDVSHQRVYHITDAPPPTLCLVLAAIAPAEMELLTGAPALAYLRAVGTVEAAVRALVVALEEEVAQRACAMAGTPLTGAANARLRSSVAAMPACRPASASSATLSAKLPEELNWRDDREEVRAGSGTTAQLSASASRSLVPSAPRLSSAQLTRPAGPRPVTASSLGLLSARGQRRPDSATSTVRSRFREQKPLDEISASVVARAKARRLLETLRRQTVPINRFEWYVRAETEAPPLETNFVSGLRHGGSDSDSNDSDAMVDMEERLTLKVGPRAASTSMNRSTATAAGQPRAGTQMTSLSGPDSTNLYRLGGLVTVSTTPKAHQATFDRLSKPRCDPRLLSGISRAPRLSAARREAVLRRRQRHAQEMSATQLSPPYAGSQSHATRLPAPKLYAVPTRPQHAVGDIDDVNVSMSTTTTTTAATATADQLLARDVSTSEAHAHRRHHRDHALPHPVAYELSYGSADEDPLPRRAEAPPPKAGRGTSARRARRRLRHAVRRGGRTTSSARPRSTRSLHHSPGSQSQPAEPGARAKDSGLSPHRATAHRNGDRLSSSASPSAPAAQTSVKGSRRPTRRHRRPYTLPSPAVADARAPRGVPTKPSEDPYPYQRPARPSQPSATDGAGTNTEPTSQHPSKRSHRSRDDAPRNASEAAAGGAATAVSLSTTRPAAPRAAAPPPTAEKFTHFEHHVMRRFSNTGEPIGDGRGTSPHLSPDTEQGSEDVTAEDSSSAASYAKYGSSSDDDDHVPIGGRGSAEQKRPRRAQRGGPRPHRYHHPHPMPPPKSASEAALTAQLLAREREQRFSASFPALTGGAVQPSNAMRRPSYPRRVLAPLLVASSASRMPSELRPGSASRVEPLNPLLFSASFTGTSAGRPPLTPMGASPLSTHRRLSM